MVILNKLVVVVVVVVVVLTRVSLQENTEMDVFAWRPKKILTRWPQGGVPLYLKALGFRVKNK